MQQLKTLVLVLAVLVSRYSVGTFLIITPKTAAKIGLVWPRCVWKNVGIVLSIV